MQGRWCLSGHGTRHHRLPCSFRDNRFAKVPSNNTPRLRSLIGNLVPSHLEFDSDTYEDACNAYSTKEHFWSHGFYSQQWSKAKVIWWVIHKVKILTFNRYQEVFNVICRRQFVIGEVRGTSLNGMIGLCWMSLGIHESVSCLQSVLGLQNLHPTQWVVAYLQDLIQVTQRRLPRRVTTPL